jgi:NhaP-type Na+/H+ or K+/H+ antiporter
VGVKSVQIRDKVVYLFDTVICDSVDIENTLGVSISDLKSKARDDLNQLSNFLYDSLSAMLSGISMANNLTTSAESVVSEIRLGGWPAILVSGLLFILPAFFVVGVSCAFKNIRAKKFQLYLSYIVLPMFMGVIGFCAVVCCILIPVAAMNAGKFCCNFLQMHYPTLNFHPSSLKSIILLIFRLLHGKLNLWRS